MTKNYGLWIRRLFLVAAVGVVSACTGSFAGCNKGGTVCVDGVTESAPAGGRAVTSWMTTVKDPDTGEVINRNVTEETSETTGGRALVALAGTVPAAAVNGAFGLAIANAKKCDGGNCGGPAALASAQTLVSVKSGTNVSVGTCPSGNCGGVKP